MARDIEKFCSRLSFVAKLRRLADTLERDRPVTLMVAGRRVRAPRSARYAIEYERERGSHELEFQIHWVSAPRRRKARR